MPATGGGRAVHKPSKSSLSSLSMLADKGKSAQSSLPRRESTAGPAGGPAPQRPDLKTRAYSASAVPKHDRSDRHDHDGGDDLDREEITDDSFFQRFHCPQPVESAKDDASDHSLDSSSDTEGPLSPTHIKYRQPAGDASSDSSSRVSVQWSVECGDADR